MDEQIKMTYTDDRVPHASTSFGNKNPVTADQVYQSLSQQFTGGEIEKLVNTHKGDPFIVVKADNILNVVLFLRDAPQFEFINLQVISAVDYLGTPAVPAPAEGQPGAAAAAVPARIEMVYILYSYATKSQITLKVMLPRDNPQVPTICAAYRSANWYERECYDMMGVVFQGHPNLLRVLCPQDWVGHPLRKDYVFAEEYNGMKVPL